MNTKYQTCAIVARVRRLAMVIDATQLDPPMIEVARVLCRDYYDTVWPIEMEPSLRTGLYEQLFTVGYRIDPGAGPLRELSRRLTALADLIAPQDWATIRADSVVLTPVEAAVYLGLDRLGVTRPEARVRYLVKTKRLRSIRVLGRTAFQRSELDEYLSATPKLGVTHDVHR